MKESNRQKKISQLLQEELATIFQKQSSDANRSIIITVTEAKVTADLGIAKVYLSIFPPEHRQQLMKEVDMLNSKIRKIVGNKLGKHLRKIPELVFYLDTTLDDVEKIEKALKGKDQNPLI